MFQSVCVDILCWSCIVSVESIIYKLLYIIYITMGRHKAPYHDVMITYYIDICMLHDYLYVNTDMNLNKHDLLKAERVE